MIKTHPYARSCALVLIYLLSGVSCSQPPAEAEKESVSVSAIEVSTCTECRMQCTVCDGCMSGNCTRVCEDCVEHCEQTGGCGYVDSTPICNYLERGIDDQIRFLNDRYVISPPAIKTLADIDQLMFGLDLPSTHCVDNPISVPCADRDYTVAWPIDSVSMTIDGVQLFFEEGPPTGGPLFTAHGGRGKTDGVVGRDRTELRANPKWGLSENEVGVITDRLYLPTSTSSPFPDQPIPPGALHLSADDVSRLIEGIAGPVLAMRAKTDDCQGQVYCDNGRGIRFFWRGTETAKAPECDFGGCPPTSARQPSPWLEIRGTTTSTIEIDLDLEVVNGTFDPGDCDGNLPCLPDNTGTLYTSLGTASLRVSMTAQCVAQQNSTFTIALVPTHIDVNGDAGLINVVEAFFDLNDFLPDDFQDALKQDLPLIYDQCPNPLITVGTDGSVDLTPPQGAGAARLLQTRKLIQLTRFLADTPAVTPRVALQNAIGRHVASIPWSRALPPTVPSTISGPVDLNEKYRFQDIQHALEWTVALSYACSPTFNFSNLMLPPPTVDAANAILCSSVFPPGNAINDARCADLGALKAFVMQPEVYNLCVLPNVPVVTNDTVVAAYNALVAIRDQAADKFPFIEKLIPVPRIVLDLETGRSSASDTFAFVDFSLAANLKQSHRDTFGCRNRESQDSIIDPYTYPDCEDPDDDDLYGTPGCACTDLNVAHIDDILVDGGYPDGEGSYALHGLYGAGQWCNDGEATVAGNEVVCGKHTQQGKDYGVCRECNVTTKVGCRCDTDTDCEGFEEGLMCWGKEADGWAPSETSGRCLPAPINPNALERLTEMRWFCLDNCDATDTHASTASGCMFNQFGSAFDHGTCVNVVASCPYEGGPTSSCELAGYYCGTEANGSDTSCMVECEMTSDCEARGFPSFYICDQMYGQPHCVPPECAQNGQLDSEYCKLFH